MSIDLGDAAVEKETISPFDRTWRPQLYASNIFSLIPALINCFMFDDSG